MTSDQSARRQVVLASASPARLKLLRNAGIEPRVVTSHVDEDEVTAASATSGVQDLVALLAEEKARDVARRIQIDMSAEDHAPIVIGCDSLLEWQSVALGKPLNAQVAVERLRRMQGTAGVLHTGHHVIDMASQLILTAVASTTVAFSEMSGAEIDAYVATGEPINVAGSFTLDGLSSPFIDGIDGDPSNVIGLSLPLLRRMLAELDVSWLDVVRY